MNSERIEKEDDDSWKDKVEGLSIEDLVRSSTSPELTLTASVVTDFLLESCRSHEDTADRIFKVLFRLPISKNPLVAFKVMTLLHRLVAEAPARLTTLCVENDGFLAWIESSWSRERIQNKGGRVHVYTHCFVSGEISWYATLIRNRCNALANFSAAFTAHWMIRPAAQETISANRRQAFRLILRVLEGACAILRKVATAGDAAADVKRSAVPVLVTEICNVFTILRWAFCVAPNDQVRSELIEELSVAHNSSRNSLLFVRNDDALLSKCLPASAPFFHLPELVDTSFRQEELIATLKALHKKKKRRKPTTPSDPHLASPTVPIKLKHSSKPSSPPSPLDRIEVHNSARAEEQTTEKSKHHSKYSNASSARQNGLNIRSMSINDVEPRRIGPIADSALQRDHFRNNHLNRQYSSDTSSTQDAERQNELYGRRTAESNGYANVGYAHNGYANHHKAVPVSNLKKLSLSVRQEHIRNDITGDDYESEQSNPQDDLRRHRYEHGLATNGTVERYREDANFRFHEQYPENIHYSRSEPTNEGWVVDELNAIDVDYDRRKGITEKSPKVVSRSFNRPKSKRKAKMRKFESEEDELSEDEDYIDDDSDVESKNIVVQASREKGKRTISQAHQKRHSNIKADPGTKKGKDPRKDTTQNAPASLTNNNDGRAERMLSGSVTPRSRSTLTGTGRRGGAGSSKSQSPFQPLTQSRNNQNEYSGGSKEALVAAAQGRKTPSMNPSYEIMPYEVLYGPQIGSGGFGVVYKAKFRNETVAVKKIHAHALSNASSVGEFQSEVAVLCTLKHPNILRFVGACTKPPNLMILTEFMARGTLFDLLHQSQERVTWGMRRKFALDTCRGMQYLHDSKLLHRDLKSSNLMLDKDLNCKVGDFGLTRISKGSAAVQMTGQCGTFQYMAVEVLANKPYSEKADVFSFGILLWEMVARKLPYFGMQPVQVGIAVMQQGLRPTIPPNTPDPVSNMMRACWDNSPSRRPSFAQLTKALESMPE